jgi:hypothetical protein
MATLAEMLRQTGYAKDGQLQAPAPTQPNLSTMSADYIRQLPQKFNENQAEQMALLARAFPDDTLKNADTKAMAEMAMQVPIAGMTKVLPRKDLIEQQLNALNSNIYGGLQEANKSTFPKIPVGNVFKNPQGKLPEGKIKSFDDVMEMEASLPTKEIDINAIVPTQRNINFENLKKVKNVKDAKDAILAVENDGKYYLIDGHHRVANDILRNKDKINVKVYEQK